MDTEQVSKYGAIWEKQAAHKNKLFCNINPPRIGPLDVDAKMDCKNYPYILNPYFNFASRYTGQFETIYLSSSSRLCYTKTSKMVSLHNKLDSLSSTQNERCATAYLDKALEKGHPSVALPLPPSAATDGSLLQRPDARTSILSSDFDPCSVKAAVSSRTVSNQFIATHAHASHGLNSGGQASSA